MNLKLNNYRQVYQQCNDDSRGFNQQIPGAAVLAEPHIVVEPSAYKKVY